MEKEELIAAASIDDELVLVCVCCTTTGAALFVLLAVIAPGAISQVTVSLSLFAGNFQHKCVVVLPLISLSSLIIQLSGVSFCV